MNMTARELTPKERLNGIVATNLVRMFGLHRSQTVYLVNSDRGTDQLIGEDVLKAVTDKLDMALANNLAATGGGGNTMLYLDIDLTEFQPYSPETIYLHLERSVSRLAAMLRRFHVEIHYTGLVLTVGAAPYRTELFSVDPAQIMQALTKGLNNHLPHQCTEMVGHYLTAAEAQRLHVAFAPLHSYSFSLDLNTPASAKQPLSLPAWKELIGEVELEELMAIQTELNPLIPEPVPVPVPAPVAVEPEPVDAPELQPTPAEQEAVSAIQAMAPIQEILEEALIGSKLLAAGGSLLAADSLISYVIFPANIAGEAQRVGFCQNGTFVTHEADGPHAKSIVVMLGNQLAIDLVTDSDKQFQPDELLFLQGHLDRFALMEFYVAAIHSIGAEDDVDAITNYFGGIEQLREQLEKFFEVLPSNLN
jgi:hypothetical protein